MEGPAHALRTGLSALNYLKRVGEGEESERFVSLLNDAHDYLQADQPLPGPISRKALRIFIGGWSTLKFRAGYLNPLLPEFHDRLSPEEIFSERDPPLEDELPDFDLAEMVDEIDAEAEPQHSKHRVAPLVALSTNEPRDAWMYGEKAAGKTHKEILNALKNDHVEWELLETEQSVGMAIDRYCNRHDLPKLRRKSG